MGNKHHSDALTIIDIERRLSKRIRAGRFLAGLTLNKAATQLGISTQQMHKYELGISKIHAKILWKISFLFKIPIDEFYSDKFLSFDEHEIEFIHKASTFLQSACLIYNNKSLSILVRLSFAFLRRPQR